MGTVQKERASFNIERGGPEVKKKGGTLAREEVFEIGVKLPGAASRKSKRVWFRKKRSGI